MAKFQVEMPTGLIKEIEKLEKELIEDIEKDLTGWSEFAIYDNDSEEITVNRADIRRRIIKLKELCGYDKDFK